MLRSAALPALVLVFAGPAAAEIVELTVVHTNDIHGGIDPSDATFMNREFPPRLGGAASMATLIGNLRRDVQGKGGHFLLVDSGDTFQGTPIGTLTKGRAVIDFMNTAGYDLLALGNHDFDEGKENTQELVERAKFPVLAANLVSEGTDDVVDWVEPWIVKDYGNLRVGVIGLITPETSNMSFPANIAGLEFAPMAPVVRRAIEELRRQDVDVIFAVGHVGIPYDPEEHFRRVTRDGWPSDDDPRSTAMDVAHAVTGLDAFFCGHIHKGFDEAWVVPNTHTLLFQTYGRGSGAGIVTLTIDTETNQILDHRFASERGYLITFFEDEFWPDPDVRRFVQDEVAKAEAGMDRVIGQASAEFTRGDNDTPMGNAVCDAMVEESGADFAFTNLGGIRAELAAGPVTPRDVFEVLPFGNKLVVIEIPGTVLREIIEARIAETRHGLHIGGGRVVFNMTRPDWDRVTRLEVGGKPWDPNATYRVATSDFLMQGNSDLTMLPGLPEDSKVYTGKTVLQALENWIARHSPVSPTIDGRWVRDDAAAPDPAFAEAAARARSAATP
ncbi:MAG: bifunctional metallophosphatase/5'-nucleotidase [Candidatus Eiseniibacteriota bacterium]